MKLLLLNDVKTSYLQFDYVLFLFLGGVDWMLWRTIKSDSAFYWFYVGHKSCAHVWDAHAWQTMTLFTIRAPEWRGLDSVNSYVFNACVVWDEVYFDPKLIYSLLTTIFCFLYLQKCQNISCTLCRIPPCSNPLMHFG